MNLDFQYWYTFLIALGTAIFATGTGFGGSVVFVPVFYFLGLTPAEALSTGLITELCGMSSATSRYIRQKQVDYKIGILLILLSIPAVVIARHLVLIINPSIVKIIFGCVIILLSVYMLRTVAIKSFGWRDSFPTEDFLPYIWLPYLGGFSIGLTSVGTCEVSNILLEKILKYKVRIAIATAVFVNGVSDLVFSILNFEYIRWDIAPFTMAGVIIGGQIGPYLNKKLSPTVLRIIFSIALIATGIRLIILEASFVK